MNNSKIIFDNFSEEPKDKESFLLEKQGEMAQIVEAISEVEETDGWRKLKRLVFDGVVETLERQLKSESERKEVDVPELYRLQGQLAWARKYADLKKLAQFFKTQLDNIKLQIQHEKNSRDGAL